MPRRKPKPKPRTSGPTQSLEARRATGRTRIDVWLPDELVARLDAWRGERTRRDVVEAAIALVVRATPDGGPAT